jgi:hypothetical protein
LTGKLNSLLLNDNNNYEKSNDPPTDIISDDVLDQKIADLGGQQQASFETTQDKSFLA